MPLCQPVRTFFARISSDISGKTGQILLVTSLVSTPVCTAANDMTL